ncbi:hypothetical protein HK405_011587, partial [Cladochytrium tenue]
MPSATLQASSAAAFAAISSPFDLAFLDEDDAGTAKSLPPPPPPPRSRPSAPPAPLSPPPSASTPAVPAAADDGPSYVLPPRMPLPPSRMRICWFPEDEDGDTASSGRTGADDDEVALDSSPMSAAWPLSFTSAAAAAGSTAAAPAETDADSSRLSSGSSTLDPAVAGPASSASGFRPRHRPVADPIRLAFLTTYKLNQSIGTDIRLARVVLMQNMLEIIYLSWSDILPQLVDAAAAAASFPSGSDSATPNEGSFDVPLAALLSPSDTVPVTSSAREPRNPKTPTRHVVTDDIDDDDDNTPLSKIGAGAVAPTNRGQTRSRASAAAGVASAFSHVAALLSSARRRSAADSDASSTSVSTETPTLSPASAAAATAASAGPKLRHRTSMASIRSEASVASLPAYGSSRQRRRRRTPAASPAPSPAPSSAADLGSPRTSGSRSAAASPAPPSRASSPRLSGVGMRIRGLLRIPAQGAPVAAAPTASILPADDDPRLLAGDVRRRRHSDSDADPDGAAAAASIWSYQLKLAVSSAPTPGPTPVTKETSSPPMPATLASAVSVDAAAAAAARSPLISTPAVVPTADAAVQTDPVEDGDIVWLPDDAGSSTSATTAVASANPTFGSDTSPRPRPLSDLLLSFAPDELADLASLTQLAASGAAWPLATLELQERDARCRAAGRREEAASHKGPRGGRATSGASSPPQSPTGASPVLLQRMHRVARSFDAVAAATAASPAFRDDYPGARVAAATAAAGGAPPVVPSRRSSRNWQDLPSPVLRSLAASSSSSSSSSSSVASAFSFAPSVMSDESTSASAPTSAASSPPDL